jgi:hypothetical protein
VRRQAYQLLRTQNLTGLARREVGLAKVDTARAGESGDIRPVIDEEPGARGSGFGS